MCVCEKIFQKMRSSQAFGHLKRMNTTRRWTSGRQIRQRANLAPVSSSIRQSTSLIHARPTTDVSKQYIDLPINLYLIFQPVTELSSPAHITATTTFDHLTDLLKWCALHWAMQRWNIISLNLLPMMGSRVSHRIRKRLYRLMALLAKAAANCMALNLYSKFPHFTET